MREEEFRGVQGALRLGESLDNLADSPLVASVGSLLSTLQIKFSGSQFRSPLESLQDSIAELTAQHYEGLAPPPTVTAFDAISQCVGFSGALQTLYSVNTGLSDHSETLRKALADSIELVSSCQPLQFGPDNSYDTVLLTPGNASGSPRFHALVVAGEPGVNGALGRDHQPTSGTVLEVTGCSLLTDEG